MKIKYQVKPLTPRKQVEKWLEELKFQGGNLSVNGIEQIWKGEDVMIANNLLYLSDKTIRWEFRACISLTAIPNITALYKFLCTNPAYKP